MDGEPRMSKAKGSVVSSSSGKSSKSVDDSEKDLGALHKSVTLQKNEDGEQSAKSSTVSVVAIASTLSRLKKQVQADRVAFVKTQIEANNLKLQGYTSQIAKLSETSSPSTSDEKSIESKDLLTLRMQKALCRLSGPESSTSEREGVISQEDASNGISPIIFGSSSGGKSVIRPLKLPAVQKIPPYTTWIFLDRNQRMTEDQSVLGRRRIYYDQTGGEALICSDSEEEVVDDEEEKHEFSNGDDFIIWMTLQEHGLCEASLEALGNCIEAKPSEIEARYGVLLKDNSNKRLHLSETVEKDVEADTKDTEEEKFDEKDLDTAMDSFDNLFCRRCLVFDCRLHGCSQSVVVPTEKQPPWTNPDGSCVPCGPSCHMLVKSQMLSKCETQIAIQGDSAGVACTSTGLKRISQRAESASSTQKLGVTKVDVRESGDESPRRRATEIQKVEPGKKGKKPGRKPGPLKKKRRAEGVLVSIRKRQCRVTASDMVSVAIGGISPVNDLKEKLQPLETTVGMNEKLAKLDDTKAVSKNIDKVFLLSNRSSRKHYATSKVKSGSEQRMVKKGAKKEVEDVPSSGGKGDYKSAQKGLERGEENYKNEESPEIIKHANYWSPLENGLYEKGLEIFGRNSCLIARNMLKGFKTCIEVAEHIRQNDIAMQRRITDRNLSLMGANGKLDCSNGLDVEFRPRTRFWRRRGRVRRLKYTWKSAGHPAIRKRIADGKDQPCKQYLPCGCQFNCGKQCSCLRNGTCCEKYCGCSKSCKNRFRGCHCAKSQCRSRQCPCFAAGRECDPDVCRNCWVGCGDGTLGGPPQRGDNYECRNMKLLLKQQQRVLLGRSDVAGWGAFLKNPVSKHDYLGEYTGELISHREADKRGKIYDRENSSFLFNLNDQYVLDAYRKGDKLKFANHSPNPNCYAKVIMVAGDHRVGIFAKERISAGEELFYDYRYEPDRAPSWAKRPESSNVKRDETSTSSGRAQKVA